MGPPASSGPRRTAGLGEKREGHVKTRSDMRKALEDLNGTFNTLEHHGFTRTNMCYFIIIYSLFRFISSLMYIWMHYLAADV